MLEDDQPVLYYEGIADVIIKGSSHKGGSCKGSDTQDRVNGNNFADFRSQVSVIQPQYHSYAGVEVFRGKTCAQIGDIVFGYCQYGFCSGNICSYQYIMSFQASVDHGA